MWGYARSNGPSLWPKMFPAAGGQNQSPINIEQEAVTADETLQPVRAIYENIRAKQLDNTGHSWKVSIGSGTSSLTGGPLEAEYVLEQLHAHWGKDTASGSEHTVSGTTYPAELHLVHWNKTDFGSFDEASSQPNGLAVLGIFVKVGSHNPELDKITKLLPFVEYKGQAISLTEGINPSSLLPRDGSYWTYSGSLTTPPCHESVLWTVFEEPIEASEEQLEAFRKLKSFHPCEEKPSDELEGNMVENYRPACPLNDRMVRNFKDVAREE